MLSIWCDYLLILLLLFISGLTKYDGKNHVKFSFISWRKY